MTKEFDKDELLENYLKLAKLYCSNQCYDLARGIIESEFQKHLKDHGWTKCVSESIEILHEVDIMQGKPLSFLSVYIRHCGINGVIELKERWVDRAEEIEEALKESNQVRVEKIEKTENREKTVDSNETQKMIENKSEEKVKKKESLKKDENSKSTRSHAMDEAISVSSGDSLGALPLEGLGSTKKKLDFGKKHGKKNGSIYEQLIGGKRKLQKQGSNELYLTPERARAFINRIEACMNEKKTKDLIEIVKELSTFNCTEANHGDISRLFHRIEILSTYDSLQLSRWAKIALEKLDNIQPFSMKDSPIHERSSIRSIEDEGSSSKRKKTLPIQTLRKKFPNLDHYLRQQNRIMTELTQRHHQDLVYVEKNSRKKIELLSTKVQKLEEENELWKNQEKQSKSLENETLRLKKLNADISKKLKSSKDQYVAMKREFQERIDRMKKTFNEERRKHLHDMKDCKNAYERIISQIKEERNHLRDDKLKGFENQDGEIESLRILCAQLSRNADVCEQKNGDLTKTIQVITDENQDLKKKIHALEASLEEQRTIKDLKNELKDVTEMLDECCLQNDELIEKNEELLHQKSNFKRIIKEMDAQINNLRSRIKKEKL